MIYETKTYQLMNKDTVVLEQVTTFVCKPNGTKIVTGTSVSMINEPLPFGFVTLEQWLTHRITATQRMDVRALLNLLGVRDTYEFVEVFHAVSLSDTFWVRNKDAETHLKWRNVSPYTNPLDERIRRYAFDSVWDAAVRASRVTAEYSTDGTFAKCWQREGNTIYLCKYGTSGASNSGLEPYSEYYVKQLSDALGIKRSTAYTLHKHNERIYTKCKIFTTEQTGLVSLDTLLYANNTTVKTYAEAYNFLAGLNLQHLQQDFSELMVLDALTYNVDRHFGNIGVLFDTKTLQLQRLAPVYDNNLALLPYWNQKKETVETYVAKHTGTNVQDALVTKTGEDFVTIGKQFLTPQLHNALQKLITSKFVFKSEGAYNLPNERLEVLSKMVIVQAKRIINW